MFKFCMSQRVAEFSASSAIFGVIRLLPARTVVQSSLQDVSFMLLCEPASIPWVLYLSMFCQDNSLIHKFVWCCSKLRLLSAVCLHRILAKTGHDVSTVAVMLLLKRDKNSSIMNVSFRLWFQHAEVAWFEDIWKVV